MIGVELTEMIIADDVAAFREPERHWRSPSLGVEREMTSCAVHELPEVELWG